MNTKYSKSFILTLGIGAIVAVVLIILAAAILNRKAAKPEEEETYTYGFSTSEMVTEAINDQITRDFPDETSAPYDLKNETIYGVEGTPQKDEDNIWIQISDDEWMAYAVIDKNGLYVFNPALQNITQQYTVNINTEVDQSGYIGISYGGFRAGTITTENNARYYIMQYYIASSHTCAFITTNPDKIEAGKALLDKNVLTMIEDVSNLEGTDFEEETNYSEEEEAQVLMELYNNAYYQEMTMKKDYTKLRLLFSTSNFDAITEIYLRDMKTRKVFYPVREEEHDEDECVFVIDDVHKGDKFEFVMFADRDPGIPEAAPIEYEESETVKRRNNPENDSVSEDVIDVAGIEVEEYKLTPEEEEERLKIIYGADTTKTAESLNTQSENNIDRIEVSE